jgi:hypothetical protein
VNLLRRLRAAMITAAVVIVASCGVPTGGAPTTVAASDVPYGLAAPSSSRPAPTSPGPRREAAWIYLVGSDAALVPRGRDTGTGSLEKRLAALLDELAEGPTSRERNGQLSTALPPNVTLSVAGIQRGTATIDLSGSSAAPSGVESRRAVAQIVLSATSLAGVDAVLLTSEGDPIEAPLPSGELTDEPLLPADYAVFLTPPLPPTASPVPSGSEAQPFRADTRPDTAEPSPDAAVTVTNLRIGRHGGFDRVVLEVDGAGIPGWDVRYVPEARSQGDGEPVAVAGEAVLRVTLTGVGLPGDTGVSEYAGPDRLSRETVHMVTETVFDGTFEGTAVTFVGSRGRAPFRVYLLQAPTRVVLEVAG